WRAWGYAEALGSPVPAKSVLPDASVGSTLSEPIAFVAKLPDTNCQLGPLLERALVVSHMPPPAAATRSRQLPVLQLGSIASAVMRPEVVYSSPLNVKISGKFAVLGPISDQVPTGACPAVLR